MKIRSLSWTPFRVPFRRSFTNAYGTVTHRDGMLLRLVTDDGFVGMGEASPLPEFGGGRLQDALGLLRHLAPRLIGSDLDGIDRLLVSSDRSTLGLSAVACGVDTAWCDAAAKREGLPVARLLAPSAASRVAVNATIGVPDTDDACRMAVDATVAGFTCVKVKVGLTADADHEWRRVAAVREAIGSKVRLRLDANGAWSPELARSVLKRLGDYDIEYIEQPIAPGNLDELRVLRELGTVAIAVDEDLTDLESAQDVVDARAADLLILKPMMAGGLRVGRRIIELAVAAGLKVVVTTTLDTGVGTAAAVHLAATLTEGDVACGLATADLLADDLVVESLTPSAGYLEVGSGPGFGVTIDDSALQRYMIDGGGFAGVE